MGHDDFHKSQPEPAILPHAVFDVIIDNEMLVLLRADLMMFALSFQAMLHVRSGYLISNELRLFPFRVSVHSLFHHRRSSQEEDLYAVQRLPSGSSG
jgi:hypothetical protein